MNFDEQLRMAALINRLIYDEGDTFETNDALELSAMLPAYKFKKFKVKVNLRTFGTSLKGLFSGLTNTGHKVSIDDDEPKVKNYSNHPTPTWVGKYAVFQEYFKTEILITIKERFDETKETPDTYFRLCLAENKKPELYKYDPEVYNFLFIRFCYFIGKLYKTGTSVV